MDMLVNLYNLPARPEQTYARISRVLPPDLEKVRTMVRNTFGEGWASECLPALCRQPSSCYTAVKDGKILGFACFDATALGYFGPIGLLPEERGSGLGTALLIETLYGMREAGYGYAVIGWCDDAAGFYAKAVHAIEIPGSDPEKTVYGRMVCF